MSLIKPVFLFAFANDDSHSLKLDEEWRACERALQNDEDAGKLVFNLTPSARLEDVFDKFNRFHNRITIFHYGGHSGSDQLQLVDRPIMNDSLATVVGQEKNLKLVFLNGCSNADQVTSLFTEKVPAVIATSSPIHDKKAIAFSKQFYTALTAGRNIEAAYRIAAKYIGVRPDISPTRNLALDDGPNSEKFAWNLFVNQPEAVQWKIADGLVQAGPPKPKPRAMPMPSWTLYLLGITILLNLGFWGMQQLGYDWNSLIGAEEMPKTYTPTVVLHGPEGFQDILLENEGRLNLELEDRSLSAAIGDSGVAVFVALPLQVLPQAGQLRLDAPGYQIEGSNIVRLGKEETFYIKVSRVEEEPAFAEKSGIEPIKETASPEKPSSKSPGTEQKPKIEHIEKTPDPPITEPPKEKPSTTTVRCRTFGIGGITIQFTIDGIPYEKVSVSGQQDVAFTIPTSLLGKRTQVRFNKGTKNDHSNVVLNDNQPFTITSYIRSD